MKKALFLAAVTAFLSACGSSSSERSVDDAGATASPAATASPSSSPAASATPSPSSSASPQPSVSPTATPGVQPTPTPTPDFGEKGACLLPVSPQAPATVVSTGPACVACSVTDPEAVKTATRDDVAEVSVTLGLIPEGGFADLSLKVPLLLEQDPTVEREDGQLLPVPDKPGFLVSFPDPALLTVAVAPTITIDTMLGEDVVDTTNYGFGFFDQLVLGLVGLDINNAQVYLPVTATSSYDAIRLSITGGLATVLLDLNVHAACIAGVAGSISGDF